MLFSFKQFLLWCLGGAAVVIPTSMLTVYYAGGQDLQWFQSSAHAGQVDRVPFDNLDAARSCGEEAAIKFEGRLLHSSIDWHSTRFQESRNVFVVMLNGTVGTYGDSEAVNIYCYVSPKTEKVSYFKAYDSSNRPMLSNAINMDAMLKSFKKEEK